MKFRLSKYPVHLVTFGGMFQIILLLKTLFNHVSHNIFLTLPPYLQQDMKHFLNIIQVLVPGPLTFLKQQDFLLQMQKFFLLVALCNF